MVRELLRTTLISTTMFVVAGCSQPSEPASSTSVKSSEATIVADTILSGGMIYTQNEKQPTAQAIAMKGDEIIFVGSNADAMAMKGESTSHIELKGQTVLPGFIDAHSHAVAGGLIMNGVDLQADTKEEILARIKKEVSENKGDIIFGYGIRFNPWTDGFPTAAMLDEIESERPVYLWAISGHAAWVNSKALEIAGITKDTPETVPGYSFYERDEQGNPTGWVVELPAQMEVLTRLVTIDDKFMAKGVKSWLPRFSAAGITSVQDLGIQGMTQEDGFAMFTNFAESGELPVRVQGVFYWNDGAVDPIQGLAELSAANQHPLVQVNKIKVNLDGGDDSENALYVDGYANDPSLDPQPIIPVDILNKVMKEADAQGIDTVCHCFGDKAVRMLLDAVEYATTENPKRDRRHAVTHGNSVHQDDIARFGELNVIYDSSGAWMSYDPNLISVSNVKLGEKRVQEMFPAQKIVDAGGMFSLGSDWPVSGYVSEYRPLVAIETAVTRTLDGRKEVAPLGGSEAGVSIDTAVKAATINAAYNMGREKEIGSIAVGKKADIVVLDEDIYQVNPDNISEIKVMYTLMGGDIVYQAKD